MVDWGGGLVMLTVLTATVYRQECTKTVPLGECKKDEGPSEPVHLQAVYLGSTNGSGWWRYPTADGWVRHYEHETRTITETEDFWAKWIWHDCGNGFVCLESGKYPNYYFYGTSSGLQAISYSSAPEAEDWTKQRVVTKDYRSRGLYMFFVSEKWYKDGYRKGLPAYIYIPPRCDGFKQVVAYSNRSPALVDYKYTYERGVTRTETTSTSQTVGLEVSLDISIEVTKAIASASVGGSVSGSFSQTWTNEKSTASSEKQKHESSIKIPPGKHLVI